MDMIPPINLRLGLLNKAEVGRESVRATIIRKAIVKTERKHTLSSVQYKRTLSHRYYNSA
jgi:hypothetical protein